MNIRSLKCSKISIYSAIVSVPLCLLVACTVRLVSPYDQVIDDGLVNFNNSFLEFMANIREAVPDEQASYANNTGFYNTQQAKLGTLVQRSKAADPQGNCPGTELTEKAAQQISTLIMSSAEKQGSAATAKPTPAPAGS